MVVPDAQPAAAAAMTGAAGGAGARLRPLLTLLPLPGGWVGVDPAKQCCQCAIHSCFSKARSRGFCACVCAGGMHGRPWLPLCLPSFRRSGGVGGARGRQRVRVKDGPDEKVVGVGCDHTVKGGRAVSSQEVEQGLQQGSGIPFVCGRGVGCVWRCEDVYAWERLGPEWAG